MTDTEKPASFIRDRWKSILLSLGFVVVILAVLGSDPSLPMPDDEREFFARRVELLNQAKAAGGGTRTYDEIMQDAFQHAASMQGKNVTDWACRVDDTYSNTNGPVSAYCFTPEDSDTRFYLYFTAPNLIEGSIYPGDILKFSGKLATDGYNVKVNVTAASILSKSK